MSTAASQSRKDGRSAKPPPVPPKSAEHRRTLVAQSKTSLSQAEASPLDVGMTLAQVEDIWKEARTTFLDRYNEDCKQYDALSMVVEDMCDLLLKLKGIHYQVSRRPKDPESLKVKVDKVITTSITSDYKAQGPNTIKNVKQALELLDQKIRDRAGVRVLVYFPEDVVKTAQEIRDCVEFLDQGAVVSFTKSRRDHRDEDRKTQQNDGPLNYSDGPWISYSSVSTNDIIQRWKHSGYRAAHLHVELTPEAGKEAASAKLTALEWTQMFRAKYLPKSSGGSKPILELKDLDVRLSESPFLDLEGKLAEIQVTTVVMHAWSQVEHDITYKMPPNMLNSRAVDRMLDGINGLSITTEIMLEELERNLEDAKELTRAKDEKEGFNSVQELQTWLNDVYLRDVCSLYWELTPRYTQLLYAIWSRQIPQDRDSYQKNLKAYLPPPRHLDISPKTFEKLDISLILLRGLCAQGINGPTESEWNWSIVSQDIPEGCAIPGVPPLAVYYHSQLLVARSLDFLIALSNRKITEDLVKHMHADDDIMERVYTVFKESRPGDPSGAEINRRFKFANDFLQADMCHLHDVAVALSLLSWFPIPSDPSFPGYNQAYSVDSSEFWPQCKSWFDDNPSSIDNGLTSLYELVKHVGSQQKYPYHVKNYGTVTYPVNVVTCDGLIGADGRALSFSHVGQPNLIDYFRFHESNFSMNLLRKARGI